MLGNRMLGIFGPKRVEVAGDWRRLHSKELHNSHTSPNIIRMIKSRRMRWVGYIERIEETGNTYNLLVGKPEGKSLSEDLGIDGRMLKWILLK
jgi:hypothetical protein